METFYNDGHILVENTRYVVGNKTFPINSISSVEPKEIPYPDAPHQEIVSNSYTIPAKNEWISYANVFIASSLFIVSVIVFLVKDLGYGLLTLFLSFFATPMLVKFLEFFFPYEEKKQIPAQYKTVYTPVPSDYCVSIVTSAGEQETFTSSNKNKIIDITEAINKAIISRG